MPQALADGYLVGTSVGVWLVWLVGILLGAMLGSAIPETWSLEFFIPLTFISILIPMLRNKAMIMAALVAAIVTLLGQGLAYNLGLVIGAFAGIGTGLVAWYFKSIFRTLLVGISLYWLLLWLGMS